MIHRRRFSRLPVLLLAAGLGAGAACGGSGSGSNGVASIKSASDKPSDSNPADKEDNETDPEDAMLAFARCMREHGIDMPDPDTSGAGPGVITFGGPAAGGAKLDIDSGRFQEADKACRPLMGDAGPMNLSPEQQQEMQDRALAFSRCMREHGINMPDPQFGGEGEVMMKIGDDSGIDPSDPKFESAQQACGSAFGPAGAKGGPSLTVSGGKADGSGGGDGPRGAIFFGGATASSGSGGGQ